MTITDLDDRLARLGTHLDDERQARRRASGDPAEAMTGRGRRPTAVRRSRRLALAGAAAVVVVAMVVAVAARLGDDDIHLASTGPQIPAPAQVPLGAPAPGTVAPYVAEPPDWFGDPLDGRRPGTGMTGRMTSTAIGVERDGGRVGSPIWVGVTDGSLPDLDQSDTVVVDGDDYRSIRHGAWQTLASVGHLTVVASGAVDTATLASVIRGARTGDTTGGLALRLDRLPAGYTELVAPQRHAGEGVPGRRTLAGTKRRTGVNEVSEWVRPELAAGASGADYEHVAVGDFDAWTWVTTFNPAGTLRGLVWSPEPGVVLEISTNDMDLTVDDLVDLAEQTRLVPVAEWDDLLSTAVWFDRPLLPSTTVTIDAVERLDADRVLVTVRFPSQGELRTGRLACWELYATPGRDSDLIGVLTEPEDDEDVGSLTPVSPGTNVECPTDEREGAEARFALSLPGESDPAGHYLCYTGGRPQGCVKVPGR